MAALDMASLKAYVQGCSSQNKAEDTVFLHVSHSNLKQKFMELRFDLHASIVAVKEKLRNHCGTAVESMRLELYDDMGVRVAEELEDSRMLGYYSPRDSFRVHVVDLDPTSLSAGGWLENTELVDKYRISEEEYNKRTDSYRKYKEQQVARDPTWTLQKEIALRSGKEYIPPEDITDAYMEDMAAHIQVGSRCEVDPGGKRGEVAFVGRVAGLPKGFWVGVKYDEPVGKNDGSVKGVRYFECLNQHGSFLRPDKVKVGDYPERDLFEDDDECDEI